MNVTVNNREGVVTLTLCGRLDTSVAAQTMAEIDRLLAANSQLTAPGTQLVCDLAGVDYISSSGLRIMLSLAKRYKNFRLVEVQPAVYDVFAMTGFSKIMTVEKALRRLNIDGCEVIGQGGVGTVYRIGDDTILKVFREGTTISEVNHEITMAKEAFVLGMPTAISFDTVRVGNQYGLVYELLRADTLSACIRRQPERIDEFAQSYANLFRQLHAIEVPTVGNAIPNAMENELKAIHAISRYFDAPSVDLLLRIAENIPQGHRLLHCDLQTKNAMIQGGELMLIDMGEVGYGHPLIDLAHSYSAMMTLVGDYEAIVGLPKAYANDVWQRMIGCYFEGEPADVVAHRKEQIAVASVVRNFSWLSLSDSFPEAVVSECQQVFSERVAKRKDYLLGVSATFGDWEVKE